MDVDSLCLQFSAAEEFLHQLPAEVFQTAQLIQLPAGSTVVGRYDRVEYAYFVLRGDLFVCNETQDGKISTWLTMQAPTIVSDLEILSEGEQYVANVIAASDCQLLRVPRAEFSAQLHRSNDFLWFVAGIVAKKTAMLCQNHSCAAFCSSLERTALFLLQYCARWPCAADGETVVHRTRPLIASEVGVSQKTLDRCLVRLREMDCLSIVRGKVHITAKQYAALLEEWGRGE